MKRWEGKVALVTGASSGIGAAIAVELANNGLKVVGVARRIEKIEALKKKVAGSGELHPLKADIGNDEDITAAFKFMKEKFGSIHILVNNAGVYRPGKLASQDPKFLRDVINVNVIALSICTQQALKLMRESEVDDGHIVHISSVFGHYCPTMTSDPSDNIYPASKHAVRAMTETLRQELRFFKSKTRVTSISPGYVDTELGEAGMDAKGLPVEVQKRVKETVADMPRLLPKDIADAVVYALSTPSHVQIHDIVIRPVGEAF